MPGGIELPCHQPRHQATISRQHLVGADHREAVSNGDDDLGSDARQFRRQDNMFRRGGQASAVLGIVPMDPEQISGVGRIGLDGMKVGGYVRRHGWRVGQLGNARQPYSSLPEALQCPLIGGLVNDLSFESDGHEL
jgi:hypothetical protein